MRDGTLAGPPDADVVTDARPGLGSLGGLHAALVHGGGVPVLVVAWDMPFVPASLLAALRTLGETHGAAAVPDGPAGLEPLCAWYAPACRDVAAALLDAGERRAGALARAVDAARLPCTEVARHGDPATLLLSVNTPDDLARARAHAAHPGLASDARRRILVDTPSTEQAE